MKKALALILVSLWVASSLLAQMVQDPELSEGEGPEFRGRVGQLLADTPDSVRLFVAVTLAYDNLYFIRTDSGFLATFEVVSSVYDASGALVAERISNRSTFTKDYRETNLATQSITHVDDYEVEPGDYRVRAILTEKETKGQSQFETEISLASPDPLLQLSDIFWAVEGSPSEDLGGLWITRGFFTDEDSALARFQTASTGPDSLRCVWQIVGPSEVGGLGSHPFRVAASPQPTWHELRASLADLSAGDYTLHIEAEAGDRRVMRQLPFSLSLRGLPRSVVQLDLAIRQVRYIASREEMRRLRDIPLQRREAVFREFWRRRDPTPGTERNELMEEYYHRVEYANENFSTNRDGWETDRGRILILYADPSDIERHPFEINSKPYEVWYYDHLNRRFVFVDYTGYGDYELVGPDWGQ